MEVKKILEVAHTGYREFYDIWRMHCREEGFGALVFMSENIPEDGEEVCCEYWTLADLRRYVRTMNECDEVIYKWITDAARDGGYPIVIFTSVAPNSIETIHFLTVTNARVS